MFKSKKELAIALLAGRTFKTNMGGIIYYDENIKNPFRYRSPRGVATDLFGCWESYHGITEIIEKEWYDDIPEEGVLCRVWDKTGGDSITQVYPVTAYFKDYTYSFITKDENFRYAEPIKASECSY